MWWELSCERNRGCGEELSSQGISPSNSYFPLQFKLGLPPTMESMEASEESDSLILTTSWMAPSLPSVSESTDTTL